MTDTEYNPAALAEGLDPAAWTPGYAQDDPGDDDPFPGSGTAAVSFDDPYDNCVADV